MTKNGERMNLFKITHRQLIIQQRLLAGVILFLLMFNVASVHADTTAIAYGSDNSWGWATRQQQSEANELALDICNKNSITKDCAVDSTKVIARAEYARGIGYGRSTVSVWDARRQALDACGNAKCRVTLVVSDPGFYALVKSNNQLYFFLTYGFTNSDEANRIALENCTKTDGESCQSVWSGSIAGQVKAAQNLSPFNRQ